MSDQDVFDEDLMKELGLDPDEIENIKVPKKTPVKKAPPPKPAAKQAVPTKDPTEAVAEKPDDTSAQPKTPAQRTTARPSQPKRRDVAVEEFGDQVTQDLPIQVAGVLGKRTLVLKDVINFKPGDVVDFKKMPNELIDLVANGKLVAKAELVMVDGRVGARIVKIIK